MDIMIDLETMGKDPDAAITALGAVIFDVEGRALGGEFYFAIDLESSVASGGVIDPGTVMWWLDQSDEARKALKGGQHIRDVLMLFTRWITEHLLDKGADCLTVWGNGAAFDNVILRRSYDRLGLPCPWSYKDDRCYRTIKAQHPNVPVINTGTAHNALDDARTQAVHLMACMYEGREA